MVRSLDSLLDMLGPEQQTIAAFFIQLWFQYVHAAYKMQISTVFSPKKKLLSVSSWLSLMHDEKHL